MSDTAPQASRTWHVFVHGREAEPGQPFATVAEAADANETLTRIKAELNGGPEAYDRDALAPALIAVPANCTTTAAPEEARTSRTRETSR